MQLSAQGCYNPSASIQVFEKLGEFERRSSVDKMPNFLRTHPITTERLKFINAKLPDAMLLEMSQRMTPMTFARKEGDGLQ